MVFFKIRPVEIQSDLSITTSLDCLKTEGYPQIQWFIMASRVFFEMANGIELQFNDSYCQRLIIREEKLYTKPHEFAVAHILALFHFKECDKCDE